MDENPTQLQWGSSKKPSKTPLILIHDGGGTVFSYHLLGSLGRDVWAIHNPHFETGEPWEGGMDEMAQHYIQLLKSARISGEIILGGWSLGGFLSVTMARFLANDNSSNITVRGMILIDSPYHVPWKDSASQVSQAVLPQLPALVQKSFDNCKGLLEDWNLPSWGQEAFSGRNAHLQVNGRLHTVPAGHALYQPLRGTTAVLSTTLCQPEERDLKHVVEESVVARPPTAVLLRCTKPVASADAEKPARVDLFREKMVLGWDERYPEFIKAVIDVDAHHYNLFEYSRSDFSKIEAATEKVNTALSMLDTLS